MDNDVVPNYDNIPPKYHALYQEFVAVMFALNAEQPDLCERVRVAACLGLLPLCAPYRELTTTAEWRLFCQNMYFRMLNTAEKEVDRDLSHGVWAQPVIIHETGGTC